MALSHLVVNVRFMFIFMSCYYLPKAFVLGDDRCKYIPVIPVTGGFATG